MSDTGVTKWYRDKESTVRLGRNIQKRKKRDALNKFRSMVILMRDRSGLTCSVPKFKKKEMYVQWLTKQKML